MDLRSGNPYWLVRDGLIEDYLPLKSDVRCDVLIIGGGISGALAAWELVRRGFDCVLIDKRDFGQGSTCASTCLLLYETDVMLSELIARRGERTAIRAWESSRQSLAALG